MKKKKRKYAECGNCGEPIHYGQPYLSVTLNHEIAEWDPIEKDSMVTVNDSYPLKVICMPCHDEEFDPDFDEAALAAMPENAAQILATIQESSTRGEIAILPAFREDIDQETALLGILRPHPKDSNLIGAFPIAELMTDPDIYTPIAEEPPMPTAEFAKKLQAKTVVLWDGTEVRMQAGKEQRRLTVVKGRKKD